MGVEQALGELGDKIDELGTRLDAGLADVRHEMRLLHEDLKADIAALAPDFAPIRREFQAADAALREEFDRRVTPLEAAARRQGRPPAQ